MGDQPSAEAVSLFNAMRRLAEGQTLEDVADATSAFVATLIIQWAEGNHVYALALVGEFSNDVRASIEFNMSKRMQ